MKRVSEILPRGHTALEKQNALPPIRRTHSIPFLSRRNFHYEFRQVVLWSLLAGLVEGQLASIVVSRTFHGHEHLIAIASATPIAANLFSLVWGMLCVGRPKIRLMMLFTGATALCAGTVWAIPTSPLGGVWFVTQMAAAQVFLAGVVMVRSAVWRSNYPVQARGRITARLQSVRIVVMIVTALTAARLCDWDAGSFRFIYPAGALSSVASLWMLHRIRIRGERQALRARPWATTVDQINPVLLEPFSLTALLSPGRVLGQMTRVLRTDDRYRRYCIAQMLIGMANHMGIAIMVTVATRELIVGGTHAFWISLVLLEALPRLVMLGSLRRWSVWFDRVGVLRMRSINIACWTASIFFAMLADLATPATGSASAGWFLIALVMFTLRGLAKGLGQGGGALAWYLGHLHFAKKEDAEVYMGIHVSLTGLRGLIAPLMGMFLWRTIGWPVWLIALSLSVVSLILFAKLAKMEERLPTTQRTKKPRCQKR